MGTHRIEEGAQRETEYDLRANSRDSMAIRPRFSRREFLQTLEAIALGTAIPGISHAHGQVGIVKPAIALPATNVVCNDAARRSLQAILQGKTTALQLMFTGFSETCPLQG